MGRFGRGSVHRESVKGNGMKGHEEIIGIPAAIFAAISPYIKVINEVGQTIAVLLGCGIALITLMLKIRQWRRGK